MTPDTAPSAQSAVAPTPEERDDLMAFEHARGFTVGEDVVVACSQYHGPGVISAHSEYGAPLVFTPHSGVLLVVRIPNGNVWFYPALSVYHVAALESPHV